jgi:hypothetical protein
MTRIQNTVNIQHTDDNKYIKYKVLNTIIKIKLNIWGIFEMYMKLTLGVSILCIFNIVQSSGTTRVSE